uniref:Uncharacterized protein n=1 Tax=viral metagenome TaxID=1070528 RepID=A0A6C0DBH2_9ZZZZ
MWKPILKVYRYMIMKSIIKEVEDYFVDKICNKIYSQDELKEINIYCDHNVIIVLIEFVYELKEVYTNISDKDICIAILYTYYGLNLGEQTTDYITPTIYEDYADDKETVFKLYVDITTGDIIKNNENLSSKIRRFIQTGEIYSILR